MSAYPPPIVAREGWLLLLGSLLAALVARRARSAALRAALA
jgi:hypothetical protein